MDAFLEIETWKQYGELFDFASFVVIERPGFQSRKLMDFLRSSGLSLKREGKTRSFLARSGNRLIYKKVSLMDISSTDIRQRVGAGKSIRFLVPEGVRAYIVQKGLYRIRSLLTRFFFASNSSTTQGIDPILFEVGG
jgi:nicotinate-nucleotide adenylyltransferase